jgi:hypothetical protein
MVELQLFLDKKMLLTHMILPKKLKTIHHPGKRIEIWMNDSKVEKMNNYTGSELLFLKLFVSNLQEMGWTVLLSY